MTAKERLQNLRPALESRGVRDVKFCFAPGVKATPVSQVQDRVFDLLDSYMKGRVTPMDRVGDAPINA